MHIAEPILSLQSSLERSLGPAQGASYVDKPIHMTPVYEEAHRHRVLEHIGARGQSAHADGRLRTHAGVAGWFNFDVFAMGRHDALLLIDTNRNQTRFWKDFAGMLAASPTPAVLRKAVYARWLPHQQWQHDTGERSSVRSGEDEVGVALHTMPWMKSPDAYAQVRKAAIEGRIMAADANIYDRPRLAALRTWCDAHKLAVTSVYASNIEDLNKDELDRSALRTHCGIDMDRPRRMTERRAGNHAPKALEDILAMGPDALRAQGLLITPAHDFYRNPLVRDSRALSQLANDPACQIFHCSTAMRTPMYVIEGAHPLLEGAAKAR